MRSMLEKVGVISMCFLGLHLSKLLSDYLYLRSISMYYEKRKLKELGQWAVVVGADKRDGQAYSIELAKQGLNVALIGSDFSKLSKLSDLLEKYFQVFTGVISLSFTQNEFTYLEKALSNLDVGILVNALDYAESVDQSKKGSRFDHALSSIVSRNIAIVTKMCAIVMPGMVSKEKGIIVNVPSISSKKKGSLQVLSEASSAYVEKLTEELRNEYSSSGIIIQTLLPGFDSGKRISMRTKRMVLSSKEKIRAAIEGITYSSEVARYTPLSLIHKAVLRIRAMCPKVTVLRSMMESVQIWCSEFIYPRRPCLKSHEASFGYLQNL